MINEEKTLEEFGHTSDMLTYGSDKKVWRICEGCGKEDEVYYNKYHGGQILCRSCANKGKICSQETRQKLSDLNKGRTCSQETRQKLSDLNKGRTHSQETKKKISENSVGMKGKHHSEETKRKISENHVYTRGENHPNFGKTFSVTLETRKKISATLRNLTYDEWESFARESPYCPKFNEAMKEYIREKYDRRCFLCNKHEEKNITSTGKQWKLSVHHVDMNKQQGCDGHRWKLVPLCMKCHNSKIAREMQRYIEYILADESLT